MKCQCGFEQTPASVLCRMMEVTNGKFLVRIYHPDRRLLAQSPEGLGVERALEFVKRTVNAECFTTHFHWESCVAAGESDVVNSAPAPALHIERPLIQVAA